MVYHRQGQFLVFLIDKKHLQDINQDQMKIFLDKNLSLKSFENLNDLPKESIHYFVCNDTNGLSTENMFTYR